MLRTSAALFLLLSTAWAGDIRWGTDLDIALKTGKPIFVYVLDNR